MASAEPAQDPIETAVFLQELHDALFHLRELPLRRGHPLCRRLGQSTPLSPVRLHRLLLDAIEALRPIAPVARDTPRWRRYRYLILRYVEGARLDQIVAELGISERQARREHHAALHELAAHLLRLTEHGTSSGSAVTVLSNPVTPDWQPRAPDLPDEPVVSPDLENELSSLESSLDVEQIELVAAVTDALGLARSLAASRAVSVHFEASAPSPRVIAAPIILRQIFLNVFTYALDHQTCDRLLVSVVKSGKTAEVCLTPTGQQRERCPSQGSRGLSLMAAARLGEGQQVMLQTETLAPGELAVRVRFLTTRASLILVVDDNPSVIRLFRRYLQGQEFRLVQARNGIHAFQLARDLQPAAIVLDLMMPVQDGWDLFRSLRADPHTSSIPVIACSVLPERELALSLGADGFLAKPVSSESLRVALEPFCQPAWVRNVAGTGPEPP